MDKTTINNNLQTIKNYMSSNNLTKISKAEIFKISGLDETFKNEVINYDNYEAISRLRLEIGAGLRNDSEITLEDINFAVSNPDKAQRVMTRYYSEVEYNGKVYGYIVNDKPIDEDSDAKVVNSESLGYGLLYAIEKNDKTMYENLLNTVQLMSVKNKVETDNTTFLVPWKMYVSEGEVNKLSFNTIFGSNDLSVRVYDLLKANGVINDDGKIDIDKIVSVNSLIENSSELKSIVSKKQLNSLIKSLKDPFPFEIASRADNRYYGNASASDSDIDICAALIKGLKKWSWASKDRELRYLVYSYARHILDQDVKMFSYLDENGNNHFKLILGTGALVPGLDKEYSIEEKAGIPFAKEATPTSKQSGIFYEFFPSYPSDNFIKEIRDFFKSDHQKRFEGSDHLYRNYNKLLVDSNDFRGQLLFGVDQDTFKDNFPESVHVTVDSKGRYVFLLDTKKTLDESSRAHSSNSRLNWRTDLELNSFNIPDRTDSSYYYYLNQIKNVGKTSNVSSGLNMSLYDDTLYNNAYGIVNLLNLSRHWGLTTRGMDSDLLDSGFEVKDADLSVVSENQIYSVSKTPVNIFRGSKYQDNPSALEKSFMAYIDLSNSRTMSEFGDLLYKRLIIETAKLADMYNKDNSEKNIYTGYMSYKALDAINKAAFNLGIDNLVAGTGIDKAKRAMGGDYEPYSERVSKSCVHLVSYNLENLRNMFGYSDRQIVDEIDKMILSITNYLGKSGFDNPIVSALYLEKILLWDVMTDGERDVLKKTAGQIDWRSNGIKSIVKYMEDRRANVHNVYNYNTIITEINGVSINTDKISIQDILVLPISSNLKKLLIQEVLKRDTQIAFGVSLEISKAKSILSSGKEYNEFESKFNKYIVNGHFVFPLTRDVGQVQLWLEKQVSETKSQSFRVLQETISSEKNRKETNRDGVRELSNDLKMVLRVTPDKYLSQPLSQVMYSHNFTFNEREVFIKESLVDIKNNSIQDKKLYMQRYFMIYQAHQQLVFQKISKIFENGVNSENEESLRDLVKEFVELTKLSMPYAENINRGSISVATSDFVDRFDRDMFDAYKKESKASYISLLTQSLNLLFWVDYQIDASSSKMEKCDALLGNKVEGLYKYIDNEIPDYKHSNFKYYALKLRRDVQSVDLSNVDAKSKLVNEISEVLNTTKQVGNHEAYVEFLFNLAILYRRENQKTKLLDLCDDEILSVRKSDGNRAYDYIYRQIATVNHY